MAFKLTLKVCSVAVLALIVIAALGPGKLVPRSGLGWQVDHVVGYFGFTLMFCLTWQRPRIMGEASSGSRFCWRACKLLRRIAMPIFALHCTAEGGCWRGRCVLISSSDEHRGC